MINLYANLHLYFDILTYRNYSSDEYRCQIQELSYHKNHVNGQVPFCV